VLHGERGIRSVAPVCFFCTELEDIVLCRVCNEITKSSPLNGGDDGARSTSLFNKRCVYCNILQRCLSLAYGHYLTVLVAIDVSQVVNGTTIHVNEMARQLGGGGVSVTGQGRYGGSRFMRHCCGLTLLWYL